MMAQRKHSHPKRHTYEIDQKQDQHSSGQTLNPVAPRLVPWANCGEMWTSKDLGGPIPMALMAVVALTASLLDQICSFCGFSQTFYIPGFSNTFWSSLCFWLHSHRYTHCPLFSWILNGSFLDTVSLEFCRCVKSALPGWCQCLPLAGVIAGTFCALLVVT